jgi:hypothetical protein
VSGRFHCSTAALTLAYLRVLKRLFSPAVIGLDFSPDSGPERIKQFTAQLIHCGLSVGVLHHGEYVRFLQSMLPLKWLYFPLQSKEYVTKLKRVNN